MGLIDVIFTNLPFALPTEFEEFKLMDLHDCFAVNKIKKLFKYFY